MDYARILTIGLDFDGTVACKRRHPEIGRPVPYARWWLDHLVRNWGARLVLWTARQDKLRVLEWLEREGIHIADLPQEADAVWAERHFVRKMVDCDRDGVQREYKPRVDVFVDDKAVGTPLIQLEGEPHPCVDWSEVGPRLVQLANEKEVRSFTMTQDPQFGRRWSQAASPELVAKLNELERRLAASDAADPGLVEVAAFGGGKSLVGADTGETLYDLKRQLAEEG